MTTELDLGLQPILERGQPELVEPGDLVLQERLEREVGECRSAPEGQRVAERGSPLRRRERPRVAHEPLEAPRVDRPRFDVEHVPRRAGLDRLAAEHPAQTRDAVLDDRFGRRGRLAAPEVVEECVHRDDRAGVERQVGEQRALPGSAQREPLSSGVHFERSQQEELHQGLRSSRRRPYHPRRSRSRGG